MGKAFQSSAKGTVNKSWFPSIQDKAHSGGGAVEVYTCNYCTAVQTNITAVAIATSVTFGGSDNIMTAVYLTCYDSSGLDSTVTATTEILVRQHVN